MFSPMTLCLGLKPQVSIGTMASLFQKVGLSLVYSEDLVFSASTVYLSSG